MNEKAVALIKGHEGIDSGILEFLQGNGPRYIYGNGEQAAVCIGFFRDLDVDIDGILFPPGYDTLSHLNGWWGKALDSVPRISFHQVSDVEKARVLMAIPREDYDAAEEFLKHQGFKSIYTCCWKRNQYLRDICMEL